jgi:hypothetical protein
MFENHFEQVFQVDCIFGRSVNVLANDFDKNLRLIFIMLVFRNKLPDLPTEFSR